MVAQLQPQPIRVNGIDLAYIERGTGEAVVFVHGGLGDYRSWISQINRFAEQYQVISYSRRYHFPNEVPPEAVEYAAVDHRDDLAALIDALGVRPAHLVGSSYGAYIALLVAGAYPKLVRTLVIGEPPLPTLFGPDAVRAAGEQVQPSREAFERGDAEQAVRVFIESVVGEGGLDRFPPTVGRAMLDNAPEFKVEVGTAPDRYFAPFSCDDASRIQAPVLVVTGELSPKSLHHMTDELEKCLPDAERAVIPRASHGMQNMNPQAYNETVLGFLARH